MRRVDLVLGWSFLAGGSVALLAVVATAQWVSMGTLLGAVMLANAAVRLRLAHGDAALSGSCPRRDDPAPSAKR